MSSCFKIDTGIPFAAEWNGLGKEVGEHVLSIRQNFDQNTAKDRKEMKVLEIEQKKKK